jgi:hypothetical protein
VPSARSVQSVWLTLGSQIAHSLSRSCSPAARQIPAITQTPGAGVPPWQAPPWQTPPTIQSVSQAVPLGNGDQKRLSRAGSQTWQGSVGWTVPASTQAPPMAQNPAATLPKQVPRLHVPAPRQVEPQAVPLASAVQVV